MSDLLQLLKQTGLNEYESKAYAVLLELGSATAADVSKKAGVPRARVYDVLLSLEKKGFLSQELGRPVRFKAFHPETALSNLEQAKKQSFANELSQLSELKSVLGKHADSMEKNSDNSAGEAAFLVSGSANIEAKLKELLKSAQEEAIICTNEANAMEKARLLGRILSENKVSARVSFCSPLGESAELKKEFQDANVGLLKSGNSARFMVFDSKKALLFLNHEKKDSEKALLIDSSSIARFLKETLV